MIIIIIFFAWAKTLRNPLWCMFQMLRNKPRIKMYCCSFHAIYFSNSMRECFAPLIIYLHCKMAHQQLAVTQTLLFDNLQIINSLYRWCADREGFVRRRALRRCDVLLGGFLERHFKILCRLFVWSHYLSYPLRGTLVKVKYYEYSEASIAFVVPVYIQQICF